MPRASLSLFLNQTSLDHKLFQINDIEGLFIQLIELLFETREITLDRGAYQKDLFRNQKAQKKWRQFWKTMNLEFPV